MYQKRKTFENVIILFVDIVCLIFSSGMAYGLRYNVLFGTYSDWDQLWHLCFMCILYTALNVFFDFYYHFFRRGYFEELIAVMKQQFVFALSWILILYLMHRTNELSRLVFGYFIVLNFIAVYIGHILLKIYLTKFYKHSKYCSRMLVITTADKANQVMDNLVVYNEWSRIVTGIALIDKDAEGEYVNSWPVVANASNLMDYLIHNDIDEVFITDPAFKSKETLKHFIEEIENMGIIVDVNIDIFELCSIGKRALNRVGKYAVVTFARNIFSFRQIIMKRALDILGSIFGLMILFIVTIFLAPLIKLDSPGPVFFGQTRVGKNGRKFTFYKFRSMYQDAEKRKAELMKQNEVKGFMFKMEDDPRITKIGKFIRKTSIDELPQFWNVLRGDMSLVGTRPPTVDEFEKYETKHKCRLSMTPGLTGLWQISGRSNIKDFDDVIKLDMQYIDDWSISKDIKIIFLTIGVVLTRRGSR